VNKVVLAFNNIGAVGTLIVVLHAVLQVLFGSCGFKPHSLMLS